MKCIDLYSIYRAVFTFEDKLFIKNVRSKPNLDASYIIDDIALFFEAKCHELFERHTIKLSIAYLTKGILSSKDDYSLQIDKTQIISDPNNKTCEIKKTVFGFSDQEILLLDVKQFICHLLGIANTKYSNKELIYLYFKPDNLKGLDIEYQTLERQFKKFCESKVIKEFCQRFNISTKLVYSVNDSFEKEFIPKIVLEYNN